MPFAKIDPKTPAGTEKVKFGDDRIREFKEQTIANFQEISNYPASEVPALRTTVWTTATRPAGDELVDRVTGLNTTTGCIEYYDLSTATWEYHSGQGYWSVAGRPVSPPVGTIGFNTDLWVTERWNGSVWQRISGGNRGDKKDWIGIYANAETENPGWVLCDGVTRTHPEGGSYTPPNLRDRFIVGAGTSYAVGVTGGKNTHVLTVSEMPSHRHLEGSTTEFGVGEVGSTGHMSNTGGLNIGKRHFTDYTGNGQAHENRPPFYALCYLYKL
ncbi:hypothetical protein M7775_17070 [Sporomusa sphaeroides DSM 2875]|uniref:hypothetical protein n=1 Tax=Sporomusa sphaeroides TaxID=47679 RepID=UPI00202F5EE6|nr:hypothetical protein [Sporomusa sphaeroides]MCM0760267.1 hypothetical protein [Sporomusa sphaeroides DSM 2875]